MFNNRPPVPPAQPSLPYKFNAAELCDRIKEEFTYQTQQLQTAKLEYEKCLQEKTDMQRNYVMYYEMSYGLNVEMHKQSEITKRLSAILAQVLPFLSPEHQSQVSAAVERAKQVTPQELASIISEDSRYPKFPTSVPPNLGGPADQMEIYKQMQQHAQLVAAVASSSNPNSLVPSASIVSAPGSAPYNSLPSSMPPNSSNAAAAAAAALFGLGNLPPAAAAAMAAMAAGGHPSAAAMSAVSTLRQEAEKHHHQQQQQQQAAAMAAVLANQLGSNVPPSSVAANLAASLSANSAVSMDGTGAFVPHDKHRNRSPGHMESAIKRSKLQEDCRSEELVVDDDNGEETMNGDRRQRDSKMRDSGYTPSKSATPTNADRNQHATKVSAAKQQASPFGSGSNAFNPFANGNLPPYMNGMLSGPGNNPSDLPIPPFLPGVSNGGAMNGFMNPAALASMAASFRPPPLLSTSAGNGTPSGLDATAMMRAMAAASNTSLPPGVLATSTPSGNSNSTKYKNTPYCFLQDHTKGRFVPIDTFPADVYIDEIPRRIRPLHSLPHGEVVCAVTFSSTMHHVFTGGKGVVKIWDFADILKNMSRGAAPDVASPIVSLDCLNKEHYVRSIKFSSDSKTVVIGGEANKLSLYDLNSPGNPVCLGELMCQASACYALALSPNGKFCYSCGADGRISVWDLHNQVLVKEWQAHGDGASCIDLGYDDNYLWSGGLDNLVRSWDLRGVGSFNSNNFINPRQTFELEMPAQVFSLGHSPREHWLSVGLENAMVEMFSYSVNIAEGKSAFPLSENSSRSSTPNSRPSDGRSPMGDGKDCLPTSKHENKSTYQLGDRYQLALHSSCVLSLKYSHSGKWFMSTGKDNRLHGWRTGVGANIFETKENTSVLTCDISPDDRYIVTGSGEKKATLYEVVYSHRA